MSRLPTVIAVDPAAPNGDRACVALYENNEVKVMAMGSNLAECIKSTEDQLMYWHRRMVPFWNIRKRKARKEVQAKMHQLARLLQRLHTLKAQNDSWLERKRNLVGE